MSCQSGVDSTSGSLNQISQMCVADAWHLSFALGCHGTHDGSAAGGGPSMSGKNGMVLNSVEVDSRHIAFALSHPSPQQEYLAGSVCGILWNPVEFTCLVMVQVLMGEGLRSVIMHEMGHILGLRR